MYRVGLLNYRPWMSSLFCSGVRFKSFFLMKPALRALSTTRKCGVDLSAALCVAVVMAMMVRVKHVRAVGVLKLL